MTSTSHQLLREIGEALFGQNWVSDLANNAYVSVSDRSMRRWAAGTDPIPEGVWRDIRLLIDTRVSQLQELDHRAKDLSPMERYDAVICSPGGDLFYDHTVILAANKEDAEEKAKSWAQTANSEPTAIMQLKTADGTGFTVPRRGSS